MGINHTVVMQLFYWVYLHICISIGGGGHWSVAVRHRLLGESDFAAAKC